MPIKRSLEASDLPADEGEVLSLAFNQTLRLLHLVDRNDPVCEIVARKIMEIGARKGVRDPLAISKVAVRELLGPTVGLEAPPEGGPSTKRD